MFGLSYSFQKLWNCLRVKDVSCYVNKSNFLGKPKGGYWLPGKPT